MLSHLSLRTKDLDLAGRFYDAALAALGYVRVWTADCAAFVADPDGHKLEAVHQ